ncbi:putative phage abortive infection protein [Acinetobacter sp. WCHAc060025]|uniref:putative phage abortive infection protein n=1 Tax=Acinetobacter sp. WCHAc060025 TaxID=2518625 RepID=UPI0013EE5EFD|nr:putative phage abortive infection protein [Acinetobacter sp. WCHAc060025]
MAIFIGIFIFVTFLLFMYFSTFRFISSDTAVWGAFGDYIGGILNPIFALLSFSALLITLIYQNKQLEQNQEILKETKKAIEQNENALKLNQEALELNRNELTISNQQLALSAKAHIEIEKTQKIQQFDMLFATMLNELNIINKDFNERNLIVDFYGIFLQDDSLENKQVNLRKKYLLTRYFIILYQILKLISENKFLEMSEKKKYSNITRASVENALLQLLMLNCNCDGYSDDFDEFYEFLKEFSFLEHMDFSLQFSNEQKFNFYLLCCLKNYDDDVFGNSLYLESAKKVWYYDFLVSNHNIFSIHDLCYCLLEKELDISKSVNSNLFKFSIQINNKEVSILVQELASKKTKVFQVPWLDIDLNDSLLQAKYRHSFFEIIFIYKESNLQIKCKFSLNSFQSHQNGFDNILDNRDWIVIQ